jgi:anti-anti-sigma factor
VEHTPTTFDVVVSQDGSASMVGVRGELDLAATPVLASTLEAIRATGPRDVVVDLAGLAFVDVAGFRPLAEAATDGLTVRLRNPSRLARLVLDATGLGELLPVETSA